MIDGKGVISLPVKLAISFLIIGLTLPSVIAMSDNLEDARDNAALSDCCEDLIVAMTRAYYSGEGDETTVQLVVPPGGTLCIGGNTELERSSVRLLMDGELIGLRYLNKPPFEVDGWQQYLEDECYLSLTCKSVLEDGERELRVVVERYD